MSPSTAKGVPYPAASDANDPPSDMQGLATWIDGRPGVATLTTTQRDALTGATRWTGRTIWNSTLGRLQTWNGSAWVDIGPQPTWQDYTPILTAAVASPTIPEAYGGFVRGRYQLRPDKTVHFMIATRMSTGVFNAGTGRYLWSLPVQAKPVIATGYSSSNGLPIGIGQVEMAIGEDGHSFALNTAVAVINDDGSSISRIRLILPSTQPVSPNVDGAPLQPGDKIFISGTYEAL